MQVFRISASQHVNSALAGIGAARSGGRWNSPGNAIVYAAASRSLAILEMLVHVGRENVPKDRRMLRLEVPDEAIGELRPLPVGWNALPYSPRVKAAGDRWLRKGAELATWVPSAIVPHERNLLINPAHADMQRVRILADEDLVVDARLFG